VEFKVTADSRRCQQFEALQAHSLAGTLFTNPVNGMAFTCNPSIVARVVPRASAPTAVAAGGQAE